MQTGNTDTRFAAYLWLGALVANGGNTAGAHPGVWGAWAVQYAKSRPPKRYVHVLVPRTCDCNFIWNKGLCKREEVMDAETEKTGLPG